MANGGVCEIGLAAPRADGRDKVTGRERYAADLYPQNHLWAGVKRAAYPHALIRAIDTTVARAIPGVTAVLTHRDIAGCNRLGIFEKDQPILASDRVRHYGDAVALVVAETAAALQAALAAVTVDYEELPAVFDPEAARQANAPLLHPERPAGNVLLQAEIMQGQAAAALATCAATFSLTVTTPWQAHCFLETENGVAWQDEDGVLQIVASTQTPFRDRLELAEALGLSPTRIRVIAPYLGGGFGGKDGITVQGFLVLAALHSGGRPVKMIYSREESFLAGTKRHPAKLEYTLGCDGEGLLQALECRILLDTGAYSALGGEVLALALEHAGGPYQIANVCIRGEAVYTNNPVASAFRGFGVPQAAAGIEQAMDGLARTVGLDPVELRRRNVVRRGDSTATGVLMTQTTGMETCLQHLQRHRWWRERREWQAAAAPGKLRGVGVAAVHHGQGFGPVIPDSANAKLTLRSDGRLQVCSGVSDMGQGNATTCLQIVSHLLNQDYECMELILPDTARTLPSSSSSASRTTFTYGLALEKAARILRERVLERAGMLFTFHLMEQIRTDDLTLLPGRIRHLPSGRDVPLALVASYMDEAERQVTSSHTCPPSRQVMPSGAGLRTHGYPHRVFSFAATLARLEVDELTGETQVMDFLTCVEAGNILNPQLFEQQIQGGVAQGLGYVLFEDFQLRQGRIATADFSSYLLPTSRDLPNMETVSVSLHEPDGPFGMKGVGEIGIDGVYAAVANALAAIAGRPVGSGVLTGEKILAALATGRGERR